MRSRLFVPFLLAVFVLCAVARAELTLPSIFSDNMVLQRDEPIPVWGWDEPGTKVMVTLGVVTANATADDNGYWLAELPPVRAGGPYRLLIDGTRDLVLANVLVGDVWLCSGQSNMEWPVSASANAKEEIAAANHPRIRHIKIAHTPADTPQHEVHSSGWQLCTPKNTGSFSAVGYYFALELVRELDVPIGLIGSNWGGTRIEPWTPPAGFRSVPALNSITDNLDELPAHSEEGKVMHQSPTALYNGMIHPLLPFAIRGAIWYQGESNNGEGMLYHEKMKALIAGWRSVWNRDDLPFYYVQLAPFSYGSDPTRLPGIWEAQRATLAVPHTGMAVITDVADIKDIHPRNKQDVGRRLALWALAETYGRSNLVHSGPLYRSMEIDGNAVRITFDHVGGGLIAKDGQPLTWFTIAGEDRQFVDATAQIDGATVVVRADGVPSPTAVRFGWHEVAEPNLANAEGLPASPFRTDDWN
jgi:sialate O-acetylesterase